MICCFGTVLLYSNLLPRMTKNDYDKILDNLHEPYVTCRGGSRNAATSKMERFMIIVNGLQRLTIIAKRSIMDVAAVLDLPLIWSSVNVKCSF